MIRNGSKILKFIYLPWYAVIFLLFTPSSKKSNSIKLSDSDSYYQMQYATLIL